MTRPMPGPPDPTPHEDSTRPHDSAAAPWNYCPGCAAENRLRMADPKPLTDAECAAEYWREVAHLYGSPPHSSEMLRARETKRIWARFATRPHALEES